MYPGKAGRPTRPPRFLRFGCLIPILLGLAATFLALKLNLFSLNVLRPIVDVILGR